jgi:hypothetical protein
VTLKGDFKFQELSVDKLELAGEKLTVEMSTQVTGNKSEGLKASLKATDNSAGAGDITASLGFDYLVKNVNAGLSLAMLGKKQGTADLAVTVVPAKNFEVGVSGTVGASVAAAKFNSLSLAYSTGKDFVFGLVASNSFKTLDAAFFSKVNSELSVGAQAQLPTPAYGKAGEPAVTAAAGLAYKASDSATVHAKLDRAGKVAASFSHVLSPLATVTYAVELDSANIASDDHSAFPFWFTARRRCRTPQLTPAPPLTPLPPDRVWHAAHHQGVSAPDGGFTLSALQPRVAHRGRSWGFWKRG